MFSTRYSRVTKIRALLQISVLFYAEIHGSLTVLGKRLHDPSGYGGIHRCWFLLRNPVTGRNAYLGKIRAELSLQIGHARGDGIADRVVPGPYQHVHRNSTFGIGQPTSLR